jgi:hypothetical protein
MIDKKYLVIAGILILTSVFAVIPAIAKNDSITRPGLTDKSEDHLPAIAGDDLSTPAGLTNRAEDPLPRSITAKNILNVNATGSAGARTRNERVLKIGKDDLKDILSKFASRSALLKNDKRFNKMLRIRIRESTGSGALKRRAVGGIIDSIDSGVIVISQMIHKEITYTVATDDKTAVVIKNMPDAQISDLAVGMRVAAVGELTGEGNILAKRIFVIPGKATGLIEKQAPSATPTMISSPAS